jgi:hypothetical protein
MKTSYNDCKRFDLNGPRPRVLLLGNGLTRGTGLSWEELIRSVARPGLDLEPYIQRNQDGSFQSFRLPNTVMTLATAEVEDSARQAAYLKALAVRYKDNPPLGQLLELPFDAVLTTNYSYELEAALLPAYPGLSQEKKRSYARVTEAKRDTRFLIHSYNRLPLTDPAAGQPRGDRDIWHIHGELRRPSSVVLTHDEYARLVHDILEHNKKRGKAYQEERSDLAFLSWIDYFLLGDVTILGLGMDYAEFDLWWLLGRRLRERAQPGRCVFYEPLTAENACKHSALRDAGVRVESCGVTIRSGADYAVFYRKAIDAVRKSFGLA